MYYKRTAAPICGLFTQCPLTNSDISPHWFSGFLMQTKYWILNLNDKDENTNIFYIFMLCVHVQIAMSVLPTWM